jgi:hypothetical protein
MGRFLWREDGPVVYICCWPSPAQSISGPSPVELATTFSSLRFETSFLSPPATRRATVEVFDSVFTRDINRSLLHGSLYSLDRINEECLLPDSCHGNVLTEPLSINGLPRLFVAVGTCVWRAVGEQQTSVLAPLFRLSGVMSQYFKKYL